MSRLASILIPLLLGFVVTFVWASWRSGWLARGASQPTQTAASIQVRRSPLRVVHVDVSAVPVRAAARATVAATLAAPPIPQAAPDDSPRVLETPVRKFARGARANAN